MPATLDALEPKLVWKHFAALSCIPRGSKNEKAAAEHVVATAGRLGLKVRQDAAGNVVIVKPATPDKGGAPTTVLQGHLDMVCEKNEGTAHDFLKDPIRLVLEGDWVRADGTTLGADNGIGVAAALAILESTDLRHGPLEALFTIDEETGLTGAFNLGADMLTGRRMLNLDTEEEGAVYIGCAGGMDSVARRHLARVSPAAGSKPFRLKVSGLKGGHSGLDIHEGRGNALKILARALRALTVVAPVEIATLEGGSKRNAIPREAFALLYLAPECAEGGRDVLRALQAEVRAELGRADPDLVLELGDLAEAPGRVFDPVDARRAVDFLLASPHGTMAMTPDIPGLVQTSTNLAIIQTKDDEISVAMSHRSSIESAKKQVGREVAAMCELAGYQIEQGSGYPGWKPNVASPLLAAAKSIHQELFGAEPHVKAVHAGLECGIIGEKYPGMDMISVGPTIKGAHSPDEKLHVPSVATFWRLVTEILARI